MRPLDLSRRDFLAAGTGLLVFSHAAPLDAQQPAAGARRPSYPTDFNAYLRIGADGRVTCLTGKVDMGQGEMTALAQCLADELDVAYDSVDMLMGDTELCPWDGGRGARTAYRCSVWCCGGRRRRRGPFCCKWRPRQLQAPVERLKVEAGVVTDPVQNKRIAYAQLVQGKRIERHLAKYTDEVPGGVPPDWPGAAAEGRGGDGHRQDQIHGRHLRSGNALRADSEAAGARRGSEERRYQRGGEGGRPGGAGGRPDRRSARAARRGGRRAPAGQGGVRPAARRARTIEPYTTI
jgi:hypothetical protein